MKSDFHNRKIYKFRDINHQTDVICMHKPRIVKTAYSKGFLHYNISHAVCLAIETLPNKLMREFDLPMSCHLMQARLDELE